MILIRICIATLQFRMIPVIGCFLCTQLGEMPPSVPLVLGLA